MLPSTVMHALRVSRRRFTRAGRVVPVTATRLRGRSVILKSGCAIDWHSTGSREELLIALAGTVQFERRDGRGRVRRLTLSAGECAFVPQVTIHRVVNRSRRTAHYLYVTAR